MPNKNISTAQKEYQAFAKAREPKRPIFMNSIKAFFAGGIVCVLGQSIQWALVRFLNFNEVTAVNPTVAILIILSIIFTSMGIYDRIAQWAGAGTSVPVTGFANAISSAALEHRSEGFVLGVGGNMFKLAGPVIVFGVFSAFVVAIVKISFAALGFF
jgi:stage V sporulation protein AC